MTKFDLTKKMVTIDESMREIASLAELYDELLASRPDSNKELDLKKDEAKFARDRMLKLSLHAKNLLASVESHETVR